ncbi:MAG TPA: TonB-dependent receptor, partial [Novosphingobium sp.]|nr:TonB-dependent receptor [Novosphingobium sp.]
NLNLDPEKADTYTFGVVAQPSFLPRFAISADYYHIKVKDVIGAPTPGDLISACFGGLSAASATDPNCTVIRRNPFTGGLDGDPAITGGLFAPLTNQGRLFTDGIDVIANYNTDLGFADWAIAFSGNYTFNSKFKATPAGLNRECVGYYSSNCSFTGSLQPKFQWSLRNTFTIDEIDLSLLWRHIDRMEQEPDDILNGNGPTFVGTLPATGANDFLQGRDVNFQRQKAYDIFDLTARVNVNDNFTFTFAVQNLLDKLPPLVGTGVSGSTYNGGNVYPSTYDSLGRRYAVGARIRF